jgi:hypothetical protein
MHVLSVENGRLAKTMRETIESLRSKDERQQMDWEMKESLSGVARDHSQPEFLVFCRLVLACESLI